jgi:hypothetical protein
VPKTPEEGEREGGVTASKLIEKGRRPQLPPVRLQYLLDILLEIGPTSPGAMGSVPVSELEILAWQINRRRFLQPWEIEFVRRASAASSGCMRRPRIPTFAAPYRGTLTREEASSMTASLFADFRGQGS